MTKIRMKVVTALAAGLVLAATSFAGGKETQKGAAGGGSGAQVGEMVVSDGMNLHSADQFIGTNVRDQQGQQIGKIQDVMINFEKGRASFARVSTEDGKSYLVPLSALTSTHEGNFVTLNADRARMAAAPQPKQGMTEEQYGRELYEHYGLSYPWEDLPGDVPVRDKAVPGSNLTYPGPREVVPGEKEVVPGSRTDQQR